MDAADAELIRALAQGSPEAFTTLVERYVDLVYAAARRQLELQHLTDEATQLVFVALGQNARKLDPARSLPRWLLGATRRASAELAKREGRRPARDPARAAASAPSASAEWARVAPVFDEVVTGLARDDLDALLLRYFENKDLRAVGRALGVTEIAAQKRVSQALDGLRVALQRRGVELTSAELSANLAAYAIETAPPALAQAIIAAGRAPAGSVEIPALGAGPASWEKAMVAGAIVLGVGGIGFQAIALGRMHATVAALRSENAELTAQARSLDEQRRAAAIAAEGAAQRAAAAAGTAAAAGNVTAPSAAPAKR